jgi:hypothetical protein
MMILSQYSTPGYVADFLNDPVEHTMNALWNPNVARWVAASQISDV